MAREETSSLLGQIERQLATIDGSAAEVRAKVTPNFQKSKEAFATYSSFVDQMLLKATEVKVTGQAHVRRRQQLASTASSPSRTRRTT